MEKLWTKNYTLLLFVTILLSFPVSMMNTTIPLVATAEGMSNTVVGALTAVYMVGTMVTRPLFGVMIDRKGRRPLLILGAALFIALLVPLRWAVTPLLLIALRLLQSIGFSAYNTSAGTMVTDIVPSRRLVEGVGLFSVMTTVTMMSLGPAAAVMLSSESFGPVFWVGLAMGIAGLLLVLPMDNERERWQTEAEPAPFKLANLLERSILKLCGANTGIAVSSGILSTFLPVWALKQGIGNIWLYFAVYAAGMLLSRLFVDRLLKRLGTMGTILLGIILMGLALVFVGLAHSLPLFLLAGACSGFGFGINNPVVNTLSYRLCPPERRGAATATLYGLFDGGIGLGALLGGVVAQFLGYGQMFLLFSLALVVSGVLFVVLVKPQMVRQGVQ